MYEVERGSHFVVQQLLNLNADPCELCIGVSSENVLLYATIMSDMSSTDLSFITNEDN